MTPALHPRPAPLAVLALCAAAACSQDRDLASARRGVHPEGISDKNSAHFHATTLRAKRWKPMLDKGDAESCGLCHEGVAARPDGVLYPAPGAPSCASCHEKGVLDCATCHEQTPTSGAHARHLAQGPGLGLSCQSCHPSPGPSVIEGAHGDGQVDVVLDPARAAPEASYDRGASTCAVYCHDHGGARARPSWKDRAPMGCGDCHGSPPQPHYPGLCTACHREPDAEGKALAAGPFHLNGKVDLGDGSDGCAACHGDGPVSGAHPAHRAPELSEPAACAECHPAYDGPKSEGHLDGIMHIQFGPRAQAFGASPSWETGVCAGVACHGAGLPAPAAVTPSWQDTSGAPSQCGACHGIPPMQHTPSTDCGRADCHGGVVERDGAKLSIPPGGRALHINGKIEVNR